MLQAEDFNPVQDLEPKGENLPEESPPKKVGGFRVEKQPPGFFGRLLGTGKSKEKKVPAEIEQARSGGGGVDLSGGPMKKGIYDKSAKSFSYGVSQQLKKGGGSVFSAAERKSIGDMMAKLRKGGLNAQETRKGLKDSGLKKFKARKAAKIFKAKRSPSFF